MLNSKGKDSNPLMTSSERSDKNISLLNSSTHVKGNLKTNGDLVIKGKLQGKILMENSDLTVEPSAKIKAENEIGGFARVVPRGEYTSFWKSPYRERWSDDRRYLSRPNIHHGRRSVQRQRQNALRPKIALPYSIVFSNCK